MNQNVIHPFIHEYDFPITKDFSPFIQDIIKQYFDKIGDAEGANIIYDNESLRSQVQTMFWSIVKSYYEVSPPIRKMDMTVYVQNSSDFIHEVHNHILSASISAVFYLNLPKVGGGLKFLVGDENIIYIPKSDKIVLFPSWLYHVPMRQEDDNYRICVNLEFPCESRPLLKNKVNLYGKDRTIRW